MARKQSMTHGRQNHCDTQQCAKETTLRDGHIATASKCLGDNCYNVGLEEIGRAHV